MGIDFVHFHAPGDTTLCGGAAVEDAYASRAEVQRLLNSIRSLTTNGLNHALSTELL